MKWRINRTVDLMDAALKTERLNALATMSSRFAHEICVAVQESKANVDLTGFKAVLSLILPDQSSLSELEADAVQGNCVTVTLPNSCYGQSGEVRGVLHLSDDQGGMLPLYAFVLLVGADMTDILRDEANVVPSVAELLAQIETMREATAAAQKAAEAANTAAEHGPYVDDATNHWMTWDMDSGKYVDTGVSATGPEGATPYIGANGNWWVDGEDTGMPARGPQGPNGAGAGTVTGIRLNGETYEPDDTGVVDLGEIGGGAPKGGEPGQILVKQSAEDGDAAWITPTAALVGAYPALGIRVLEISLPVSSWTGSGPYTLEIAEETVTEMTDCRFEFSSTQVHIAADIDWETTEGMIALSTEIIPTGELSGRVILMEVSG